MDQDFLGLLSLPEDRQRGIKGWGMIGYNTGGHKESHAYTTYRWSLQSRWPLRSILTICTRGPWWSLRMSIPHTSLTYQCLTRQDQESITNPVSLWSGRARWTGLARSTRITRDTNFTILSFVTTCSLFSLLSLIATGANLSWWSLKRKGERERERERERENV